MAIKVFNPVATKYQYNLKAGTGRGWVRPAVVPAQFTAKSDVQTIALTASDLTLTYATNLALKNGDVLCFVATGEKVVCDTDQAGAGPYTVTVVRGVDGTIAQPIAIGDRFDKDGHALRVNNGSGYALSSTSIIVDDYSTNTEITGADNLILRRGFDKGSEEIMYVTNTGAITTTLTVIRDYTFLAGRLLTSVANLIDNEFLFVTAESFFPPEVSTYEATKWKNFEVKDAITFTPNFEVVQTDSNERIGPNFANHIRYQIGFSNVIVSPELLSTFIGNLPTSQNYAPSGIQEYQGFSQNTFFGDEVVPVMLYVRGREALTNRRLEVVAFAATLQNWGEISLGTDQRMHDLTFDNSFESKLLSNGVIREPAIC